MKKFTQLLVILLLGIFSQFSSAQVERSQLTSNIINKEPTDNLEGIVQGQDNEMKRLYFFYANHWTRKQANYSPLVV